jgi:hypothetical protein
LPEAPELKESQELSLTAVQSHPVRAVTVKLPEPPRDVNEAVAGFTVYVQGSFAA